MFKLPVCPYCNTVYSYKDVKKNRDKKIIKCYHCKNEFKKNNINGYFVLALIIVILTVALNLIILNLTADFITSIVPLMVISIIAVIIFILLTPFFSNYKKIKDIEYKEFPVVTISDDNVNKKQKRSVKNRQRKNK
jgi:CXXC-20-CXXC protein